MNELKLPAPALAVAASRRQAQGGFQDYVDMITRSALTPVLESVSTLLAPAYRQEGGASTADLPVTQMLVVRVEKGG